MGVIEIRNQDEARRYLLAGLSMVRAVEPTPEVIAATLDWAMHLASAGHALPPLGFIADFGSVALGTHNAALSHSAHAFSGVDPAFTRRYEDYVLGKLYADLSFERAADALHRYTPEERPAGIAYLIERVCARTDFHGVLLNPAVIRSLQVQDAAAQTTWQPTEASELPQLLHEQSELLVERIRNTGDLCTPEDIFELEHGTALVEFGQRFALRQVLQIAELFVERLPRQRPRNSLQRRQVATRMFAEDAYPVGGFSSLSNRGSIESLLHSQLALIEPDERPDLFDVKYVRDELLYYSRDENQFLRRRTTCYFVFSPTLVGARIKDANLHCQRIVAALGFAMALVRQLTAWLSDESLTFRFVFLARSGQPLSDERNLLELLLREEIEHGSASLATMTEEQLRSCLLQDARRSVVQALVIATQELPLAVDNVLVSQLLVGAPEPHLLDVRQDPFWSSEIGIEAWHEVLAKALADWM